LTLEVIFRILDEESSKIIQISNFQKYLYVFTAPKTEEELQEVNDND